MTQYQLFSASFLITNRQQMITMHVWKASNMEERSQKTRGKKRMGETRNSIRTTKKFSKEEDDIICIKQKHYSIKWRKIEQTV